MKPWSMQHERQGTYLNLCHELQAEDEYYLQDFAGFALKQLGDPDTINSKERHKFYSENI